MLHDSLFKIVAVVAALAIAFSCAAAEQSKADVVLQRIETLLDVYKKEHPLKEYPSTLKEFQQFAAKKGLPVDLSPFSEFSFKRSGRDLNIWYRRKDNGIAELRARYSITLY
jgi:hypothetical protein